MDMRLKEPETDIVHGMHPKPVYVYELPIRVWHWVIALAIPALSVTGYLISSPIDGLGTDWVRFLHFAIGEVLAVAMIARFYVAFTGNYHARQILYVPIWRKRFWLELSEEILWYMFLRKKPKRYAGHNPLARIAMATVFLWSTVFMTLSGFALYGEDTPGGWAQKGFGWFFVFGSSQDIRTYHHVGMYALLMFTMIHLYFVVREELMGRTSVVSTMFNGWRTFKS